MLFDAFIKDNINKKNTVQHSRANIFGKSTSVSTNNIFQNEYCHVIPGTLESDCEEMQS